MLKLCTFTGVWNLIQPFRVVAKSKETIDSLQRKMFLFVEFLIYDFQLADKNLIREAVRMSEDCHIEQVRRRRCCSLFHSFISNIYIGPIQEKQLEAEGFSTPPPAKTVYK